MCFTQIVVDVTVITLLLSQTYGCANSYRLFNVRDRYWWHQQKGQHTFKIFVYIFYKTYIQSYFVPSLLEIEYILIKIERVFQWLHPTQPTWPQKKPIFQKQPPDVFCKKIVLRNFAKCHMKTPVPEHLQLYSKRLWHRCFPVNFAKFLRTPFLQNTSGRLLLTFKGSLNLTNLKLGWISQNYCIFKNVLI